MYFSLIAIRYRVLMEVKKENTLESSTGAHGSTGTKPGGRPRMRAGTHKRQLGYFGSIIKTENV